jgi:glutamate synthase (NADPH/NADH) large chain
MKTGRDVVIGALLGAEEFGFSTAPLVTLGCVMMRVCDKNTCPVGIATQDPELRAVLGRSAVRRQLHDLRGHGSPRVHGPARLPDLRRDGRPLRAARDARAIDHWKAHSLDFSRILFQPQVPKTTLRTCQIGQEHKIEESLDATTLIPLCEPALARGEKVEADLPIRNVNRVVGTTLGSEVTRRYGGAGLPEDTIKLHFRGSAGQSFGAFIPNGLTLTLEGDANDYLGKGLSGGKIILFPPRESKFVAEDNIITGNVAFYGATSGEALHPRHRRRALRRPQLRRHGGGRGRRRPRLRVHDRRQGRDHRQDRAQLRRGHVRRRGLHPRRERRGRRGRRRLRARLQQGDGPALPALGSRRSGRDPRLLERHVEYTGSTRAKALLDDWPTTVSRFIRVVPNDYRRVIEAQARMREKGLSQEEAEMAAFDENVLDAKRVAGN